MNNQNPEYNIPEELLLLIAKSRSEVLNPKEQKQLELWLKQHPESKEEIKRIQDVLDRIQWQSVSNTVDLNAAWEKLEDRTLMPKKSAFRPVFLLRWAALIVILAGLGFLLLFENNKENKNEPIKESLVNTLPERVQKASLKLADGSMIALDTAQMHISESTAEIQNLPGEKLFYSNKDNNSQASGEVTVHELIVPAGARYQLVLADGTKVWMNSASKLSYPVAFNKNERRVVLEGEAFFEVTSSAVPFIVEVGQREIEVLGTSFNISAYSEDKNLETTLVSGKVVVKVDNNELIALAPGEQARIDNQTSISEKRVVDTKLFTSWKDDVIYFKEMELNELVKRLERWYAVTIEIQNENIADIHFTGAIENSRKLEFLLSLIAETTEINYKLENDRIVIY